MTASQICFLSNSLWNECFHSTCSYCTTICITMHCNYILPCQFPHLEHLVKGFFLMFIYPESDTVTVVNKHLLKLEPGGKISYLFESVNPQQIVICTEAIRKVPVSYIFKKCLYVRFYGILYVVFPTKHRIIFMIVHWQVFFRWSLIFILHVIFIL